MKYRIVCRNQAPNGNRVTWYYAQMKVLGTWVDCNFNPFVDTYNASDSKLSVVEEWVEEQIVRKSPVEDAVVKTYD